QKLQKIHLILSRDWLEVCLVTRASEAKPQVPSILMSPSQLHQMRLSPLTSTSMGEPKKKSQLFCGKAKKPGLILDGSVFRKEKAAAWPKESSCSAKSV